MTGIGTNGADPQDDKSVAVTIRIDRVLHEAMQAFFAAGDVFAGYDDLVGTLLQAATCSAGGPAGQKSFVELLQFTAWQRGLDFETTLFGRPGNEHDRRQIYALMLGDDRHDLVNAYESQEFRDKGAMIFARDVGTRFARDLERDDAARLIATMTLGAPALQAEMLHWLDIGLAARTPQT